ncbi:MAG: N-acetyl-gamma-glutamyl-phosphate reductase [Clostridia bacterium]|nr:N-acetyl-gamma-glutamyl-phosphate reductase [Clostridia bacterium]
MKVFIDGSAGTTGLQIARRLESHGGVELVTLPEALRKDLAARADAINSADVCFLCLPDAAAVEAVGLVNNDHTAVIDTSTAHRTASGWVYGFAELPGQRAAIAESKRVANPGCHASGFIALIAPLVRNGLLPSDARLTCFSLTGYSGGGKKMIAEYEDEARSILLDAPRQYGLTQQHKHLKEMQAMCGLCKAPLFSPIVADFYSGMEVTVPLFTDQLNGSLDDVKDCYRAAYAGGAVVYSDESEEGFLSAGSMSGKDSMRVSVFGNDERLILVSRFDNLGKGASGAAIQNMNIICGFDEYTGLCL